MNQNYKDPMEIAANRMYIKYIELGGDFYIHPTDGDIDYTIKLKDASDEYIYKALTNIKNNISTEPNPFLIVWYEIYNDVYMNRRRIKLLKIKKNINERKNAY